MTKVGSVAFDCWLAGWAALGACEEQAAEYPFTEFARGPEDPAWDRLLAAFGVTLAQEAGMIEGTLEKLGLVEKRRQFGKWDFSQAKDLVIFCNGPACDQSPREIKGLLSRWVTRRTSSFTTAAVCRCGSFGALPL